MALLFADSFDHYVTADILRKWSWIGFGPEIVAGQGRNGTAALGLNSSDHVSKNLVPTGPLFGFACAMKITGYYSSEEAVVTLWETGGAYQLTLSLLSTGTLRVRRGSTNGAILGTSTATVSINAFHHLEWKVVLHETLGTVEVRLDGVPVITASNVDTVGASNPNWSAFTIWSPLSNFTYFDDVIVYDGSGATVNDWVGDCQVRCLLPSVGNGANTGWTPSAGTDHGALVDEPAPNTTDYISGTAPGQRDTFNYPALPVAGTVKGVQVNAYALVETAGIRALGSVVRSGSTDYDTPGQAPGIGWDYFRYLYPLNPATGAPWTVAEIDAAEFGVKITA